MATRKKLLSGKNDKVSSTIEEVGSVWSTARYADFKFDASIGASPVVLTEDDDEEEKVDALDETEECSCGKDPCECESLKEADDEKEAEADADGEKKDELTEDELTEDELTEEDEDEDDKPDFLKKMDEDDEKDEDEKKDDLTEDDESEDSDDDTLALDIADLVDDEEDVVELAPADAAVDAEFAPSEEDEEDAVWTDDDPAPVNVDVDVEDEEEPLKEADDDEKDDDDGEKKDELTEEDDDDEKKKDELTTEEDEDEDEDEKKEVSEGKLRLSFKTAEVTRLFENNTVLTEEDKRQSRVLFESAIRSVAKQLGSQLRDAYQAQFEKAKSQHETKVAKQIDSYMSYVVEQWSKDNKVALQNQMRNRLTESFLTGFKKLCVDHYIEIPESKVNVVEALVKNVKTLKAKLQNAEAQTLKFHGESQVAIARERAALTKEHKSRLIAEAAGAVTPADRGEFVERARTVKFTSTKEFKKDLIALREQYFAANKTVSVERPSTEPVAMPIFEAKTETPKSSIDAYTKVADRLTRQS